MVKNVKKNLSTGACAGAGIGFVVDLISQLNALTKAGNSLTWENFKAHYDPQRAIRYTLLGAGLGAGTGLLYTFLAAESTGEPFNQNDFLRELLVKYKVDPSCNRSKADWQVVRKVCAFLVRTFADTLIDEPIPGGSSVRRTANSTAFDYDVAFVVRPEAGTLEKSQTAFYEALTKEFSGSGCTVRLQNRSVGLLFDRPDGTILKIDVLPARGRGDYRKTGDLTIWDRRRKTPLKTNVRKHNRMTVGQPQAREMVRLLKLYKDASGLPLPTPLVNQIIPTALKKRGGSSSLAGNFRFSLASVAKKLNNQAVKDIANGNNNLCGSMSRRDKRNVQETLLDDLERWTSNPQYLKTMFADVLC
jgi:hypothetical protein